MERKGQKSRNPPCLIERALKLVAADAPQW